RVAERKSVWGAAAAAPGGATARSEGRPGTGERVELVNPADERQRVGTVVQASRADAERAVAMAHAAQGDWDARGAAERADILARAADLFENAREALIARCVLEAGKTIPD